MSGRLVRMAVRALDAVGRRLPWARSGEAPHLRTGRRGEEEAYFWLRRQGYVMAARNWRSPRRKGELDLIGWEDETLCFVEVKTRSSRAVAPAEAAIGHAKQQELRGVARDYLRKLPHPMLNGRRVGHPLRAWHSPAYRFDVVTVYYDGGAAEVAVLKDAFPARD